jgi:hypothetical protein
MPKPTARAVLVAAILCLVAPLGRASIYRCTDEHGSPVFSQYPCAAAGDVETMVIQRVSVVTPAQLTKSEQATLERIRQQSHRSRAEAASDQQRARRRNGKKRAEQEALCARSRDALKRLRERKRGGYSLATAKALKADEVQPKAQISKTC